MSVGVEPTDFTETVKLAFRSIGSLATDVLRKAELAARGHDGAHKLGSGLTGEEPANPLETLDSREGPERNVNEVVPPRGDETGPVVLGGIRQRTLPVAKRPVVLTLVSTDMRSVNRPYGFPRPTLRRPVLIVDNGHEIVPRTSRVALLELAGSASCLCVATTVPDWSNADR